MASKKKLKKKRSRRPPSALVANFLVAVKRARQLVTEIVEHGYSDKQKNGKPKKLSNPAKRDVAQMVFLEVAAKFEALNRRLFLLHVQKDLEVSAQTAPYIVGSADHGLKNISGWASLKTLADRAENLVGKSSVYYKYKDLLSQAQVQHLSHALVIRNRIAHDAGQEKYSDILAAMSVPQGERRGLSPGRLLLEYPKASPKKDRWLDRLLAAYETWAKILSKRIK